MGIAFAKNRDGLTCSFVVSRYRNAGNILGLFQDKVKEGSFAPELCAKVGDMAERAANEADGSLAAIVNKTPIIAAFAGDKSSKSKHLSDENSSRGIIIA